MSDKNAIPLLMIKNGQKKKKKEITSFKFRTANDQG